MHLCSKETHRRRKGRKLPREEASSDSSVFGVSNMHSKEPCITAKELCISIWKRPVAGERGANWLARRRHLTLPCVESQIYTQKSPKITAQESHISVWKRPVAGERGANWLARRRHPTLPCVESHIYTQKSPKITAKESYISIWKRPVADERGANWLARRRHLTLRCLWGLVVLESARDMTHFDVIWLIHIWIYWYVWYNSVIYPTLRFLLGWNTLEFVRDMTHLDVTGGMALESVHDMTHAHVWHDWCICDFIHMCDMTHLYVISFICVI